MRNRWAEISKDRYVRVLQWLDGKALVIEVDHEDRPIDGAPVEYARLSDLRYREESGGYPVQSTEVST